MTEWSSVPAFDVPPAEVSPVVRPSAYGVVTDAAAHLAVVRTPQGLYLPGGGIEAGETPRETVVREVREECGLELEFGSWSRRAVDFVYSPAERTHFEKRSTFLDARFSGMRVATTDPDHELEWLPPQEAASGLAHPSHRWAVEQWLDRDSPG